METNGQMDGPNPPSLRFCPFLNIPDSSKRKNPECFYTQTIKAVYSNMCQLPKLLPPLHLFILLLHPVCYISNCYFVVGPGSSCLLCKIVIEKKVIYLAVYISIV